MPSIRRPDPEPITFEAGYAELQGISERLAQDGVPVDEMLAAFRRSRGLERALRTHLTERIGELEEIEQGQGLPEFEIVPAAPEQA
jgi:exodeoxyribonuclease VII small subunit